MLNHSNSLCAQLPESCRQHGAGLCAALRGRIGACVQPCGMLTWISLHASHLQSGCSRIHSPFCLTVHGCYTWLWSWSTAHCILHMILQEHSAIICWCSAETLCSIHAIINGAAHRQYKVHRSGRVHICVRHALSPCSLSWHI